MSLPSSVDPFEFLQIRLNPDGTLTRNPARFPVSPASSNPDDPIPVLSKDLPVDDSLGTWFRIFLPRDRLQAKDREEKLPLVVYHHGGGFIHCSAASSVFHRFQNALALGIPAVVVSVEYRLAPEHRLPAAYDDAIEALRCIRRTEDEWLIKQADFSNCYLMGSSAGGNIALHVGLRVASWSISELGPLRIRGMVLHHTYLGGEERTDSELRLVNDDVLPLPVNDLLWQLSLPIGADRDHVYSNLAPDRHPELTESLDRIKLLGWRVFVTGGDNDPSIDRQVALADLLRGKGIVTVCHFSKGENHGFDIREPTKTGLIVDNVKKFISGA
ncbi:hypothetical protein MLD38_030388 [Melastoma candidum]|uniref:Uncharacterized protein n=1 Tax=Melastoma candidum TaxID=119954 RepID=A0ACB9MN15_9MYRT|nr:hypothetical protein MLD38_030388 [Melastoma candidum]